MIESRTIELARRGDRKAQADLLASLQDRWFRMCLSMLGDAERARDATQETALRFLRLLPEFRGESQISTWSLGIAINVVRESRRHPERGTSLQLVRDEASSDQDSPAEAAALVESRNVVREHLNMLPDRQKEAVLLRYFEELSTAETAAVMKCSEGTVKATLHQALRALRMKLTQLT